jgi:hypothetical protein
MMTNLSTHPHSGTRKAMRLAVAGLGTLFVGLVAAVFWVLAQAQYINDYCTSRAPRPTLEPTGGRPAYIDGSGPVSQTRTGKAAANLDPSNLSPCTTHMG